MSKDKLMMASEDLFWYWINERHRIYVKRSQGEPWPWTKDRILKKYKFTNVFRELDKTTVWMRDHLTKPNRKAPMTLILFNCCVFRLFGTVEMGECLGWIDKWEPDHVQDEANERLEDGEKVFTGAYIITNGGISAPKTEVVVTRYLQPIWDNRKKIIEDMTVADLFEKDDFELTLKRAWEVLHKYPGFGGGGFMAYEVISDLRHTRVLNKAVDINGWANAGPGCIRGLKRIFPHFRKQEANDKMKLLLKHSKKYKGDHVPNLEMREIEHSLCEFDKYCRVKFKEGEPRSLYKQPIL